MEYAVAILVRMYIHICMYGYVYMYRQPLLPTTTRHHSRAAPFKPPTPPHPSTQIRWS